MNEYPIYKLSVITSLITDGKHGDCRNEVNSGYFFLSSKDLFDGKLNYDSPREIRYDDFLETHRRTNLEPGDILLANCGASIGRVGIAQNEPQIYKTTFQKSISVIKANRKIIHNKYLYYFLKANSSYLIELGGGTAQPNLLIGDLKRIKIQLPPIKTQKKIAAILSAYDDLIENNKRRIALLEKMAEEIYREWFVRMRFPGYKETKFEKGLPVDWEVKNFREITDYYVGGGWGEENESATFSEGAFVIRGTDIPKLNSGNLTNEVYRFHKPSQLKSRKLKVNDFIFEVSGGSKDQLLGRNIMISEKLLEFFEDNAMCASFCKLIRFNQEIISPYLMKYFLKFYYECDLVGIYQVQSTGISNYQFESFLSYQTIIIPPKTLQDDFDKIIKPILQEKDDLAVTVNNLKKTRDLLLPRLISGKLSVENLDIKFPPSMREDEEKEESANA